MAKVKAAKAAKAKAKLALASESKPKPKMSDAIVEAIRIHKKGIDELCPICGLTDRRHVGCTMCPVGTGVWYIDQTRNGRRLRSFDS